MKKFLSLALALVMTMSLVTISAGAKDFTDDSKIAYKEAVDVMSSVKVIDGYTDGAFNPANTLTRGAAAKIICNMILGPTTAGTLTADAAPFKDVPANHTFAGYIAYCAKQGIISGYADGSFRPAGTVTGYQFMKMLLGALGYDAATEGFTGANWSINVAKLASSLGLDKGNSEFVGTKAMTREEACLYAFNTLKATMVEYSNNASDITIGGVTISQGKGKAGDVANKADTETIKNDDLMQFAEKYFKDLKKTTGSDDFGRPATTWKVKAEKVGTYADKADASYTKKVKTGDIYSDLGLGQKVDAKDVTVYTNGTAATTNAKVISKGNDTDKFGGNGVLTEVFYDDDDNTAVVTMVNTYVGEIVKTTAATSSKDAYITLTPYTGAVADATFETTAAFEDEAVVLYTYSESAKEIKSVEVAKSVDATLTKVVAAKSVDMGDTTYKFSAVYAAPDGLNVKSDYTTYLDNYGYAVYVKEQKFVSGDYALVTATEGENTAGFTSNRAKLVFTDGTTKTVETAKNYASNATSSTLNTNTNYIENSNIVTYKADDKGVYTLKVTSPVSENVSSKTIAMEKNKAQIVLNGNNLYANSKTVFVVKDNNGDYKAYTGIVNAPSISGTVSVQYYAKASSTVVSIMFIDATSATISTSTSDVIFVAGKSVSEWTNDGDSEYYTYNAVVNGEMKTIKVDDAATNFAGGAGSKTNALYGSATYDKYGVITKLTAYNTTTSDPKYTVSATGTEKMSGEYTIILGTSSKVAYTVKSDAKIFVADEDGVISQGTINSVKKDSTDIAYAIVDEGQITYLFLQEVADGTSGSGSTTDTSIKSVALASNKTVTLTLNGNVAASTSYTVTLYKYMEATNLYINVGTYTLNVAADAATGTVDASGMVTGGIYCAEIGGMRSANVVAG